MRLVIKVSFLWFFYVSENTVFEEHLAALRIHICIALEMLCLPRDKGASLALVGHPSSDSVTVKLPYGLDVLLC